MSRWAWSDLLIFVAVVCAASLIFSVVGSVAPEIVLTVPANGLAISSKTVLLLASSLVSALVLFIWFPESRSAVLRFTAGVKVYLLAVGIGFLLPLASYIGARHSYSLWGSKTGIDWIRVFFINLLLSPLWEEIIWRGYFYPKASSVLKPPLAVVVAGLGWAVWHAGLIFYLYHSGISISILPIFAVQIFFFGIIQCSIFNLGNGSLAPCVLLHTAANASTAIYYGSYDRLGDNGSYVAEAVAAFLIAAILFRVAAKQNGRTRHPTALLS